MTEYLLLAGQSPVLGRLIARGMIPVVGTSAHERSGDLWGRQRSLPLVQLDRQRRSARGRCAEGPHCVACETRQFPAPKRQGQPFWLPLS